MIRHELAGCASRPLAHYLKAVAVLRLISEQADPKARAWWEGDRFVLLTALDRAGLASFFLDRYAPTPLVTPWNGGSGFYPKDSRTGIETLAASVHPRFEPYREAIRRARHQVGQRTERPSGNEKVTFIRRCRSEWGDDAVAWLSAAIALLGDDVGYPSLLGSGGNDGRLDFANNFMQRIAGLFSGDGRPTASAGRYLEGALFAAATVGLPAKAAIGQFLPGGVGGMNAGPGFDGDGTVNPWDFVLMLEGTAAFQVAAVRRFDGAQPAQVAAPFSFFSQAAGYGSATRSEESARGEQWMPLWSRPTRYNELKALLRDGRIRTGRGAAERPLQAARALAAHGAARGIEAFERYAYIERNGRSNLAVPLGRWEVRPTPAPQLLDEVAPWVDRLRRASRDAQRDPASLRRQLRGIETAMMALITDVRPARVQDLLVRLGETDAALSRRPRHTATHRLQPLHGLSEAWIVAADDGSPTFRLAAACATQRVLPRHDPRDRGAPLRAYAHPLDGSSRFAVTQESLRADPRVVWRGRSVIDDLIAVLHRRMTEANQAKATGLGLRSHLTAPLEDVQDFVLGLIPPRRLGLLMRGFMGVDLRGDGSLRWEAVDRQPIFPPYALLRCALPPRDLPALGLRTWSDSSLVHHLASGRPQDAATSAARRLVAVGMRPRLDTIVADRDTSLRLAASLMFPVSASTLSRLVRSVAHRADGVVTQGVTS